MAMSDFDVVGPLARARRVMRDAPEPGWDAISERVIAAVRATPRGGWPLTVVDPEPGRVPGTIAVADRALKAFLAHVLRDDPDYAVGAIDVVADEQTVVAVRVAITGRYDVDLNATAERVLALCAGALDEVIGAAVIGNATAIPIEVVVTDVQR